MNDVDEIAKQAYYLWEEEDRPVGRDLHHWLQAEAQLSAMASAPAAKVTKAKDKRVVTQRKPK